MYQKSHNGSLICSNEYYYKLDNSEYNRLNLDDQHSETIWLSREDLLTHNNVHENTKRYFK